jgi:hypothetical protein
MGANPSSPPSLENGTNYISDNRMGRTLSEPHQTIQYIPASAATIPVYENRGIERIPKAIVGRSNSVRKKRRNP